MDSLVDSPDPMAEMKQAVAEGQKENVDATHTSDGAAGDGPDRNGDVEKEPTEDDEKPAEKSTNGGEQPADVEMKEPEADSEKDEEKPDKESDKEEEKVSEEEEEDEEKKEPEEKEKEASEEKVDKKASPVNKKEEMDEGKETEEDTEGDDEDFVPLLERPPETSGRRERKKVERFDTTPKEGNKRTSFNLEEGTGTKLGDCPVINHNINTFKPEDVHMLHQVIFNRQGKAYECRKNLRSFRGFPYTVGSPSYKKKLETVQRYRLDVLRSLCNFLDLEKKSKDREMLGQIVMDFLCNPQPSGREVKEKKRKSGKKGRPKKKDTPKKKKRSTGSSKKAAKEDSEEGSDEDEDEDAASDEENASDADSEKAAKTPAKKKATPKKTPAKKTPAKKAPAKKTPAKKTPAAKKTPGSKRKKPADEDSDLSSSEDNAPLKKKQRKADKPPTDNEIKALVKKLLEGANLEQVTMKNILTQVYAKYPTHDLTARKDFIKTTVKALIS